MEENLAEKKVLPVGNSTSNHITYMVHTTSIFNLLQNSMDMSSLDGVIHPLYQVFSCNSRIANKVQRI